MTENSQKIFANALNLTPIERAELVEQLLSSFEFPDRTSVNELWAKEAEDRIDAFEKNEIDAISAKDVFKQIGRN